MSHTSTVNKDDVIRVRIASAVKSEAGKILERLGLTYSEAISLFLSQVRLRKGLPFDVKIPNKETLAAMRDALSGENLASYRSTDDMFADAKDW